MMRKRMLKLFIFQIGVLLCFVLPAFTENQPAGKSKWDGLLMESVLKGDIDKVKSYIAQGAEVNAVDSDGRTPLINAVEKGSIDIVNLLLAKNASISVRGKDGLSPLITASQNGNSEILKLLLNKNINAIDYLSGLSMAVKNGHRDVVDVFSEKLNIKRFDDMVCLAAKYGRNEVLSLLIEKGADVDDKCIDSEVDEKSNNARAPLMFAAAYGHTETVKLLLAQKNIEINTYDRNYVDSLMLACEKGYQDIAALLIENKADAERSDSKRWTSLMYAVKGGNAEIVKMLIDVLPKRRLDNKNNEKKTALDISIEYKQTEIEKLLRAASSKKK